MPDDDRHDSFLNGGFFNPKSCRATLVERQTDGARLLKMTLMETFAAEGKILFQRKSNYTKLRHFNSNHHRSEGL